MGYIGDVTIGSNSYPIGSTLYGTCATTAGTPAKVVTMANFDTLKTGVTIHVKFTNSNTASAPTLNVNNTGAKVIYRYQGTAPSTTEYSSWQAGAVISFTYDGTYWIMNDCSTFDPGNLSELDALDVTDLNAGSLIVRGNARFINGLQGNLIGNVTGNVTGNADTATTADSATTAGSATKATQDSAGNVINTTYVKKIGDTITGTLTLSKNTDLSGTANNSPALIVGGEATVAHIEIDADEIQAKATGTTTAALYLNKDGGKVYLGPNVEVNGTTVTATTFSGTATNATNATNATTAANVSGQSGTSNAYRNVWFSDSATETKRNSDADFQYNPSTNTLKVSNITGNAATATSATSATTATNVSGESGTGNSYRNVWFSDATTETKRNSDGDFQYNPALNTLKVGNVIGDLTGKVSLASKTYSGLLGTSSNNAANDSFYFMKLRQTDFYGPWMVKYRIRGYIPGSASNANLFQSSSEVMLYGVGQVTAPLFHIFNQVYSGSYRPYYYHNFYRLTAAGYNSGYANAIGIGLRGSNNRDTTGYERTIEVEILETYNCECELLVDAVKWANWTGNTGTNYAGLSEFDGISNGLCESGDANTVDRKQLSSFMITAGTNGIYGYSLVMEDGDSRWQSIVKEYGNTVTHTCNTVGFRPEKIYYYSSSGTIANGARPAYGYLFYESIPAIDFRYSSNCATTLTAYEPLYLVGTIQNGLFYLDSQTWWTQTLPTTADSKYYLYLGQTNSTYTVTPTLDHPIYYFDGYLKTWSNSDPYEFGEAANGFTYKPHGASSSQTVNVKTNTLEPIASRTYEGLLGTASNNAANDSFYYIGLRPKDFYTHWKIKYRVTAIVPGNVSNAKLYQSSSEVTLYGPGQAYAPAIHIYNWYTHSSYRPYYYHNFYRLTQTGYDAGLSNAIGIGLRGSASRNTAGYERTITVEVLEQENCTFEFLESPIKWANWTNGTTTNYAGLSEFDGVTLGLCETNDVYYYDRRAWSSVAVTTGQFGMFKYTLAMEDGDGKWHSLTKEAEYNVTHTKNTTGFRPEKLLYFYSSVNVAANTLIGAGTLYEQFPAKDFRYDSNCGTTLTNRKPVYIVGTISNGLFYLDDTWYSQTLPTTANGKYYLYVGEAVSNYQVTISVFHPIFYFDGHIKQWHASDPYEFTGGTNSFTYKPRGDATAKTVTITPSLQNLVDGSATGSVRGTDTSSESSSYTIGASAFAEGNGTKASGDYAHAEGTQTTSSGEAAHSEGILTTAQGNYSHAEGISTIAYGDCAHVEGCETIANGTNSHVEGQGTVANYANQHVFGAYNTGDNASAQNTERGNYIEIVGKGTADNARSNARTLDWDGNEILAGKLTVGTAPTANMDVATKQYVDTGLSGKVGGSGTASYLAKFTAAGTIGNGPAIGSATTTYLRNDGSWATPPGTGVASITTGTANGTISVTPQGGTASDVAVKGLGSNAYLSYSNCTLKMASFYGMCGPTEQDDIWIRTTSNGLLPYQEGGGSSALGTALWPFASAYIKNMRPNTVNFYPSANNVNNGGYLDFHYNQASSYTSRIIESASGIIEINKTLYLSNTTDVAKATNNNVALIIGARTGLHLEFDGTEIMAKSNASTASELALNYEGGQVTIGAGGLKVNGNITATGVYSGYIKNYADNTDMRGVTSYGTDGQRISWIGCNASNQLAIRAQWGSTGASATWTTRYAATTTSDIRLKKNINSTKESGLDLINKINLCSFDWKLDGRHQRIGFIADYLEAIDKDLVFGGGYDEDGAMNVKSVNSFYLQGYEIKAIQELSAQNKQLKRENKSLEKRISLLEKQIERLVELANEN